MLGEKAKEGVSDLKRGGGARINPSCNFPFIPNPNYPTHSCMPRSTASPTFNDLISTRTLILLLLSTGTRLITY